jgi:hypothetical protein
MRFRQGGFLQHPEDEREEIKPKEPRVYYG